MTAPRRLRSWLAALAIRYRWADEDEPPPRALRLAFPGVLAASALLYSVLLACIGPVAESGWEVFAAELVAATAVSFLAAERRLGLAKALAAALWIPAVLGQWRLYGSLGLYSPQNSAARLLSLLHLQDLPWRAGHLGALLLAAAAAWGGNGLRLRIKRLTGVDVLAWLEGPDV